MNKVVITVICCERGQGGHTEAGSVTLLLAVTMPDQSNSRKERFLLIQSKSPVPHGGEGVEA